jgi:hypothetical protein
MRRDELDHLIRAAGAILGVDHLIVIGSQAILASYEESQLPPEALYSREADIVPPDDPDERRADLIDGAIGEGSLFHETFGIYADGVSVNTARLPSGWEDRLIPYRTEGTGDVTAWCLDPHDLLVAKYMAHREKDLAFCRAVVQAGLVDPALIAERIALTPGTAVEHTLAVDLLRAHLSGLPPP